MLLRVGRGGPYQPPPRPTYSRKPPIAIIKLGATVIGIRGTIGGITYSANKSGPYARAWGRSSNPRTTLQSQRRGFLGQQAQRWRALTPAQRTAWDAYAAAAPQQLTDRFGDPFFASGYNWFCRLNQHLLLRGKTQIDAAPVIAQPAAPPINSLVYGEAITGDSFITYPAGTFGSGNALVILMAVTVSSALANIASNYSWLLARDNPFATAQTMTAEVALRFGPPVTGMKAFVRVHRETDEGRRSPATALDDVAACC